MKDSDRSMTPSGRMISSVVNRDNLNLQACLYEWIDNAFGPASGNAQNVRIVFGKELIQFIDDGDGVQSLRQMLRYADSGSRDFKPDIGQYGIGGVESMIWLGSEVLVQTVRGYKYSAAFYDWSEVDRTGEWPDLEIEERAATNKDFKGTVITVMELHKHEGMPRISTVARDIGKIFAAAIDEGRTITIVDSNGEETVVEQYFPAGISDQKTIDADAGGLPYSASIGILSEKIGTKDSGIRVYFGLRLITIIRALDGENLPARVSGKVTLGLEWKEYLNAHKNDLTNATTLQRALARDFQDVIKLAAEYEEIVYLDTLALNISTSINEALRRDKDGDHKGTRAKPKNDKPGPPKPHPRPPVDPDPEGDPAKLEQKPKKAGIRIEFVEMEGSQPGEAIISRSEISFLLNRDSPMVMRLRDETKKRGPRYHAGFMIMLGLMLASKLAFIDGGSKIARKLTGAEPQTSSDVYEAVVEWWSEAVADDFGQPV